MSVTEHQAAPSETAGGFLKKAAFTYLTDGRPETVDDQVNAKFDRNFKYDFAAHGL